MKRLFVWAIGLPIGLLAIVLSIANRGAVTFSLDPLSTGDPVIAFEAPLFVLLFAAAFIGLVIGWLVGWAGQAGNRRELRARRRQMRHEASAAPPATGRALVPGP